MSAFFELHKDLPREGPGDLESLNWAFSNIDLAQSAVILDAACGPGADIEGLLGQVPLGRVVGLDKHQPFVDVATSKFANHDRVQIVPGDMATPPGGPYDAIWHISSRAVLSFSPSHCFSQTRRHKVRCPSGMVIKPTAKLMC